MKNLTKIKKTTIPEHSMLSKEELLRKEEEKWRELQRAFNNSDLAKELDEEVLQALDEARMEEEMIRKQYGLK